ncbi:hypothetical protein Pcinc_020618 [Petrolisthes cinctipes]|uniref:Uncharacterized protein n=1 Tax=Petrolisthes cinctipes TaxID=88211 RepID=A0AAE1FHM7_PETCI|nr:hypothetical protein Pcinc_020618 [Petrolisthes cinctipes]
MRRQGCVLLLFLVGVLVVLGVEGYGQLTPATRQQTPQAPAVTSTSTSSPFPPPHIMNSGISSRVEYSGTLKERDDDWTKAYYDDDEEEDRRTWNIRDQSLSESARRKREERKVKREKGRITTQKKKVRTRHEEEEKSSQDTVMQEEVRVKKVKRSIGSQEAMKQEEVRVKEEESSEGAAVDKTGVMPETTRPGDEGHVRYRSTNLCVGYKSNPVHSYRPGNNNNNNNNNKPDHNLDLGYNLEVHDMRRWTAPTPITLPGMQVCREPRWEHSMGTAPPNVCDLCPVTADSKNPLDPCTCVGNSGTLAGKISITCPPTIVTLDQIKDIFTHTDFISEHVFRFTLQGSNVSGVLTKDLWGPLDFVQVLLNNNRITHVDNYVFNNSADTLTTLNLDNNEIQVYANNNVNDLPNLTTLILSRNDLQVIYSGQFVYSSLKALHLSNNLIHTIGENSFAALDKLETLKLDNNQLTEIGDMNFHFYNHNPDNFILDIDLSSNNIRTISPSGFMGLKMVQIDLQYNQLTTISKTIFQPIILDSVYYAQFFFCGEVFFLP